MAKATLPPQAYTRDVLAQAFAWMQAQPTHVKNMAHNADALVALYAKAQRQGLGAIESDAPVSAQTFKSDLKSLAEDLRQFEPGLDMHRPQYHAEAHSSQPAVSVSVSMPTPSSQSYSIFDQLDGKSLGFIQEVKSRLNLGSEVEVLRLLITLGVERVKSLFPS